MQQLSMETHLDLELDPLPQCVRAFTILLLPFLQLVIGLFHHTICQYAPMNVMLEYVALKDGVSNSTYMYKKAVTVDL